MPTCETRRAQPACAADSHKPREAEGTAPAEKPKAPIHHTVIVLSGKGGVGKSTVAVNLALSLAEAGKDVGLLDIDIHGPSIPTLLHLQGTPLSVWEEKLYPVQTPELKVVSIGFLLEQSADAVIWRGPMKAKLIKQFVDDVLWGELDYLVVDCPPGTGDEPLSIVQTLEKVDGAVVVTTPQDVALTDVRKSITFCRKLQVPVLGVVENMSGLRCPHCGHIVDVFKRGGGERMAADMEVPFLGRIPIDPEIMACGDAGEPYVTAHADSEAASLFREIAGRLLNSSKGEEGHA